MAQIGGKIKKAPKASQPQFVVESSYGSNQFMKFVTQEDGSLTITWTGDANEATQFTSKFAAKSRICEIDGIPAGRVIKELM